MTQVTKWYLAWQCINSICAQTIPCSFKINNRDIWSRNILRTVIYQLTRNQHQHLKYTLEIKSSLLRQIITKQDAKIKLIFICKLVPIYTQASGQIHHKHQPAGCRILGNCWLPGFDSTTAYIFLHGIVQILVLIFTSKSSEGKTNDSPLSKTSSTGKS